MIEILRWKRDGRVINLTTPGPDSDVAGLDYDPAHQEVVTIGDQRHDGGLRILGGASRTLRGPTAAEKSQEKSREDVDDTLVDGPVVRGGR